MKFDRGSLRRYPEIASCPITEPAIYERIKTSSREKKDWERTVFIDGGEAQATGNKDNLNVLSVDEALRSDSAERTWYTSLPSIMYHWAEVTLQESISLNHRRAPWDKHKHFVLIERVCRGLTTLHSRGMLHADVRPANIVFEGDASDPNNYLLSDYGSFADPGARAGDRNPDGKTVLGPVVSGERISAFYAPERRHSTEREAANRAVIYNPGSTFLYAILGWGSDLIDPNTKEPRDNLAEMVKEDFLKNHETAQRGNLVKGDRIQIREYIFDVEKEWHVEDKQILKCSSRYWKIYHGRIVVESLDRFQQWDSFPISRTVELRQWQAAIDLYSLGALALYSVFYDSVYKQQDKSIDNLLDRSVSGNKTKENHSSLEDRFREMLGYLDSTAYFNSIWPELEWMRKELENHLASKNLTEKDLANKEFNPYDPDIVPEKKEERFLKGAVVALVGRIAQSVPGAREVVEALDYDLGTFIFFIHFVLCCLHRQSDVNPDEGWTWMDSTTNGPFAIDRLETPARDGAALKALQRIEHVSKLIEDRLLSGLKLESSDDPTMDPTKDIPFFDPRPTSVIRADLERTKAELDQAKTELDQRKMDLDQTKTRIQSLEVAIESTLGFVEGKLAPVRAPFVVREVKEILQKAKADRK